MLCFGSEWRRSGFCVQDMNHTGDRVNGGDRPESGQMPGRCGIVQRAGGKGLSQGVKIKIFRKHGVRGRAAL